MNILKNTFVNNEKGSAIIAALLMGLALSLAVLIAVDNTMSNSRMMRNSRQYVDELYDAETGITVGAEDSQGTWLAIGSPLFNPTSTYAGNEANAQFNGNALIWDETPAQILVANYVVARIENSPQAGTLSDTFNYDMNHQAPPRIGSGNSPKDFEIRRYGLRSTAQPANTVTVEAGLSRTFNK